MSWPTVIFGEIMTFLPKSKLQASNGSDHGSYKFFTSSSIQKKWIDKATFETSALVIGSGGRASIHYAEGMFSTTADCFVVEVKDKNDIYLKYVYHFISSNIHILEEGFKGAGLKHISKGYINELKIPFPTLAQQKRIAVILDKVAEIKAKREEAIAKLDELAQSTFVEMFGDPNTNSKGWNVVPLGEVISVLTDYHANGSYEILRDNVDLRDELDFALMLRTTDLENNNFVDGVKYISEKAYDFLEKSKVFGGEVIINKIGSAGKVYFVPQLNRPTSLGMNSFLLRFTTQANSRFIYDMLKTNFCKSNIASKVRGAVTKTITKDAVRSILIPLPPIGIQEEYINKIDFIQKQIAKFETSLANIKVLQNSMQHQAFTIGFNA